jgi:hypothetical protein
MRSMKYLIVIKKDTDGKIASVPPEAGRLLHSLAITSLGYCHCPEEGWLAPLRGRRHERSAAISYADLIK